MSALKLDSTGHSELARLRRYIRSSPAAYALHEVIMGWLAQGGSDPRSLTSAVDCWRRDTAARETDKQRRAFIERQIGSSVVRFDVGGGVRAAVSLSAFQMVGPVGRR